MEKTVIIIILLFLTSLSYSQTAEEYFQRGVSKVNLENYQGAIADYSKAIEINPKFSDAYYNRGYLKNNLEEDYEAAITDYTMAITLSPNDSDPYCARGDTKYNLGQTDSACLDWQKSEELGNADATERIKNIVINANHLKI